MNLKLTDDRKLTSVSTCCDGCGEPPGSGCKPLSGASSGCGEPSSDADDDCKLPSRAGSGCEPLSGAATNDGEQCTCIKLFWLG